MTGWSRSAAGASSPRTAADTPADFDKCLHDLLCRVFDQVLVQSYVVGLVHIDDCAAAVLERAEALAAVDFRTGSRNARVVFYAAD